jgi:hypothetical protein
MIKMLTEADESKLLAIHLAPLAFGLLSQASALMPRASCLFLRETTS